MFKDLIEAIDWAHFDWSILVVFGMIFSDIVMGSVIASIKHEFTSRKASEGFVKHFLIAYGMLTMYIARWLLSNFDYMAFNVLVTLLYNAGVVCCVMIYVKSYVENLEKVGIFLPKLFKNTLYNTTKKLNITTEDKDNE